MSARRCWVCLIAITLLGLALRVYRLDYQSVWNDEAFSITVSALNWHALNARLVQEFMQPPLHYYLLHGWFIVAGFGALPARVLSVIFGTLAIPLIYLFAMELFERRTASAAALLMAISQVGIVYSQEARPYTQLLFLCVASAYLFLISIRRRDALAWAGFALSGILLIYTHYFGLFWLLSLAIYGALFRKRYRIPVAWWACAAASLAAAYLPWVLSGVFNRGAHHHFVPISSLTPHWWSLVSAINWFNNGKVLGIDSRAPWWTFPAGAILLSLPAVIALKPLITSRRGHAAEENRREPLLLLALLFAVPMLFVLAAGYAGGRYTFRYVAFGSLPYYILAARGFASMNSAAARRAAIAAVVIYSSLSLRAAYFVPYKQDYRGALGYVASGYQEGDCSVFAPNNRLSAAQMSWQIYHPKLPIRISAPADIGSGRVQCGRIWLVRDTWSLETVTGARDENLRDLGQNLMLIDERSYPGVEIALYARTAAVSQSPSPATVHFRPRPPGS